MAKSVFELKCRVALRSIAKRYRLRTPLNPSEYKADRVETQEMVSGISRKATGHLR
jgi:hypothetical protein